MRLEEEDEEAKQEPKEMACRQFGGPSLLAVGARSMRSSETTGPERTTTADGTTASIADIDRQGSTDKGSARHASRTTFEA